MVNIFCIILSHETKEAASILAEGNQNSSSLQANNPLQESLRGSARM